MSASEFNNVGLLKQSAISLLYNWGYNPYHKEDQLRADDLLIRGKVGWLLGSARKSVDLAERAQNENRKLATRRAQRLHQREPVELRQHPIDDGEIDGDRGCHVQPGQTVRGDIHGMTDFPQRLRQIIAGDFVVLNDQNVHGAYLTDVEPVFVGTISFAFRGSCSGP